MNCSHSIRKKTQQELGADSELNLMSIVRLLIAVCFKVHANSTQELSIIVV